MKNDDRPIDRKTFMKLLFSYKKGSISRRDFLGMTGLGHGDISYGRCVTWLATPASLLGNRYR